MINTIKLQLNIESNLVEDVDKIIKKSRETAYAELQKDIYNEEKVSAYKLMVKSRAELVRKSLKDFVRNNKDILIDTNKK